MEDPEEENTVKEDWIRAVEFLKLYEAQGATGNVAPACDQVALERKAASLA